MLLHSREGLGDAVSRTVGPPSRAHPQGAPTLSAIRRLVLYLPCVPLNLLQRLGA